MQNENIEIVVIEDEEDILELIEYHLNKEGYTVTGFLSTDNVEQFLEEETPSLMLVDRNLPGMEGSEFITYLRDIGYEIPVTRHFYQYVPPRPLEEIETDIEKVENELLEMLKKL